jgi:phage shock protein E
MKKTTIGIGVGIIAAIALLVISSGPGTQQLAGVAFVEAYHQTPKAVLIDVRTPSEFEAGHMDGAINVDFESPTFATDITKLDTATPYFMYCRSGNRSGQAITIMKKAGFKNISELQGGIVSNQGRISLVTSPASQ